jgi:DNA-directed RNA polymerase specialized sigma24 family protein
MKPPSPNEPRSSGDVAALPPTSWSLVARAGDRDRETWLAALSSITLLYRPVLVRYLILRLRVSADQAEDIVQAFLIEKLVDQNVLLKASQKRGRFRSFIIKVFSNYAIGQLRGQLARKRRPSSPEAERLDDLPELQSGDTPLADSFDALWARQVLARTLERIREECLSKDRQVLWQILEARILVPMFDDSPPMPYEELVERFGLRSPSEASNLLITAKRMFARVLREVVRETVADDKDVDAEIRELKRVLAK